MFERLTRLAPLRRLIGSTLATLMLASFDLVAQENGEGSLAGRIAVLQISEFTLVEEAQITHLQDSLEKARTDGAAAVVLEIESPGGLAIATLYPFMKRFTHLPQLFLGAAFGWGVPMSYAAHNQALAADCWWLFAATVCWAAAYDTAYAMVDREEINHQCQG